MTSLTCEPSEQLEGTYRNRCGFWTLGSQGLTVRELVHPLECQVLGVTVPLTEMAGVNGGSGGECPRIPQMAVAWPTSQGSCQLE